MPEDPSRGDRGEGRERVAPRRTRRVVAAGLLLLTLGATAVFGYDHRRLDLGGAWTALSDGRLAIVDSSGFRGPRSLVIIGQSTATVRDLPPVLRHSTSVGPARGPGGLSVSPAGWVLIRLGRLGKDTAGGQITEISPTGRLNASFPLLRWRDAAVVGITDAGLAVFRKGAALYVLGPNGEGEPLLSLDRLGVRHDLSNLADVALAPDGGLAVLVGDARQPDDYRLFRRMPGGEPAWETRIPQASLFTPRALRAHSAVAALAATGGGVFVAGDAGVVGFRSARLRSRATVTPADRGRWHVAASSLVALPHGRWAAGRDPISVIDGSGRVHRPGSGPCPRDDAISHRCDAVVAGHRLARPDHVLPPLAVGALAVVLTALSYAGREGRREGARTRLVVTILAATWIVTWLAISLVWGELHGSAPMLLLCGAVAAILAPAFPAIERPRSVHDPTLSAPRYQPWVSERIAGGATGGGSGRRLEVTPLPSRS